MSGIKLVDPAEVRWIPVGVAAARLRVSRQRVYQLIHAGHLAAARVEGRVLVSGKGVFERALRLKVESNIWERTHPGEGKG